MSENARKLHEMIDYLPEDEQLLMLHLVAKLVPDDVATPDDLAAHAKAMEEYHRGELLFEDEIDWDNLDKMDLD